MEDAFQAVCGVIEKMSHMSIVMALFVYLVNMCLGFKTKQQNPNQRQVSVPSHKVLLCRDMESSPSLPTL